MSERAGGRERSAQLDKNYSQNTFPVPDDNVFVDSFAHYVFIVPNWSAVHKIQTGL